MYVVEEWSFDWSAWGRACSLDQAGEDLHEFIICILATFSAKPTLACVRNAPVHTVCSQSTSESQWIQGTKVTNYQLTRTTVCTILLVG